MKDKMILTMLLTIILLLALSIFPNSLLKDITILFVVLSSGFWIFYMIVGELKQPDIYRMTIPEFNAWVKYREKP